MTLLRVRDLHVAFASDRGMVRAVQGISFDLDEGEVLGVVGESGSGKSVAALSIMRMIPQPPGRVSATELSFNGEDLLGLSETRARGFAVEQAGLSLRLLGVRSIALMHALLSFGYNTAILALVVNLASGLLNTH